MRYPLRRRWTPAGSPRTWPTSPRRLRRSHIVLILALTSLVWIYLRSHPDLRSKIQTWLPWDGQPTPPSVVLEPDGSGFYDWDTISSFVPVQFENAREKSVDAICASFPAHLLATIQPVLKTGHKLVEQRVRAQLRGPASCLSNLLIFSDTEEVYAGHQITDIIGEIPQHLTDKTKALKAWRSGSIAAGSALDKQGWHADKFKFMPGLSRAWKDRPNREWYVFFEGDTYISWDNVFRMLQQLNPDEPHFFGSPTPNHKRTWFAYGGTGYILSREAMRRYVEKDWDPHTGAYLGPKLVEQYWDYLVENCCGDAALGWALWWQNVTIRGLFPMFNPTPPSELIFGDRYWCQPIMTFHLAGEMDYATSLWRWEAANRQAERPLLYRDLATSYFDFANLERREDWSNAQSDGFSPPSPGDSSESDAHASFDACGHACETHPDCMQWTYHLRECTLVRTLRYGSPKEPGFTEADRRRGWLYTWGWDKEAIRFQAGWATRKIQKWIDERPCEKALWVKPSTKRIF